MHIHIIAFLLLSKFTHKQSLDRVFAPKFFYYFFKLNELCDKGGGMAKKKKKLFKN